MAANERWTCFECSQSLDANQAFYECTHCRVRFCFSCRASHPQHHAGCLVTVQKFPSYGVGDCAQQCASCQGFATFRYDCQACFYSQCISCWRALGINRHIHRAFILHELRQDYALAPRYVQIGSNIYPQTGPNTYAQTGSNTYAHEPDARPSMLPCRSQSLPAVAAGTSPPPPYTSPPVHSAQNGVRQSVPTFSPPQHAMAPLRQTQSHMMQPSPPMFRQPMYPTPPTSPNQPQATHKKRGMLTRGAKKAYAMTQKNTLTKVGTRVALTAVGVAIGTDVAGLVDGIGAMDFGGMGDSSDLAAPDTSAFDTAGASDQSYADAGTLSSGGDQDFSNLPNGAPETTAWMQQQYFQNVTLPYLAGPTITPAQLYVG